MNTVRDALLSLIILTAVLLCAAVPRLQALLRFVRGQSIRLLLGGSHRLHRNGISVGCARDFGLLPSQLAEVVQRGLIRGLKGIDFVADYQSVLSAFLDAGTNAGCGGEVPLHVLSAAHGIANL